MSKAARRPDRGGSKQRLLETAERMLAEYGIEGVSLRQIAAETGKATTPSSSIISATRPA